MQRSSSAGHTGMRARVHTVALAIVFGLLAIVAVGPHAQRGDTATTGVVPAFPARP